MGAAQLREPFRYGIRGRCLRRVLDRTRRSQLRPRGGHRWKRRHRGQGERLHQTAHHTEGGLAVAPGRLLDRPRQRRRAAGRPEASCTTRPACRPGPGTRDPMPGRHAIPLLRARRRVLTHSRTFVLISRSVTTFALSSHFTGRYFTETRPRPGSRCSDPLIPGLAAADTTGDNFRSAPPAGPAPTGQRRGRTLGTGPGAPRRASPSWGDVRIRKPHVRCDGLGIGSAQDVPAGRDEPGSVFGIRRCRRRRS